MPKALRVYPATYADQPSLSSIIFRLTNNILGCIVRVIMDQERPQLTLRTLELLKNRPRALTIDKIANDTGLTVGWLEYFSNNGSCDPAVSRVVKLYEYLTNSKLIAQ